MKEDSKVEKFLPLFALVWLWGTFFWRIHLWWNEASYYTYGWAVPFLAVLLIYRKNEGHFTSKVSPYSWGALVLLYVPFRMIAEPDPFWRFPVWLEASVLLGLSFVLFPRRVWPSFAYVLTALPWPAVLETMVVQNMTTFVAIFTQEALLWFGIPVELSGHVLVYGETEILINNTFSGIRSLQSLLSLGTFFCLYWSLGKHRIFIVLGSIVMSAFFFNLCRAVILSLLQIKGGEDAYSTWHDPIGYLTVALSFATIFMVSYFLRSKEEPSHDFALPDSRIGKWGLVGFLPELLCWLWFFLVSPSSGYVDWSIRWPEAPQAIEKPVEDVLLFDYGNWVEIPLQNGKVAKVIYYGYDGSSPAASLCSRNHNPATCMAHLGTRLNSVQQSVHCQVGDVDLEFKHYVAQLDVPLDVWWCQSVKDSRSGVWQDDNLQIPQKLHLFLSGKVSFERKVLLIMIPRDPNGQNPHEELKELVEKLVIPVSVNSAR